MRAQGRVIAMIQGPAGSGGVTVLLHQNRRFVVFEPIQVWTDSKQL